MSAEKLYRVIKTGELVRLVCEPDSCPNALALFVPVSDPDFTVWVLMSEVERVDASGRSMAVPS